MDEIAIDDLETFFRHFYVCGKTQFGKSNLLAGLALQTIYQGFGVTVLDGKGDTIPDILRLIPPERINDVIYLSGDTPVPLDILHYTSPTEQVEIAQEIIVMFDRMAELSDARMKPVLKNAVNSVLCMKERCFLDIFHFLERADGQATFDAAIRQSPPILRNFWNVRYQQSYFKNAELPLTTRMSDFVLVPILDAIFGTRKTPINIPEIIEGGKIFLVNLPSLGVLAGEIAGGLILSQIQHTVFRRYKITDKSKRRPHFLFADEFHTYKNSTFKHLLSKAGGFKLALILANQHPHQVDDLWDDIIGGCSSAFMFRLARKHAAMLDTYLGHFMPEDLVDLPVGTCLYHPLNGATVMAPIPLLPQSSHDPTDIIVERMKRIIRDNPPVYRQIDTGEAQSGTEAQYRHDGSPSPKSHPPPNPPPPPRPTKRQFSGPRNPQPRRSSDHPADS